MLAAHRKSQAVMDFDQAAAQTRSMTPQVPSGLFDSIGGLPLHPLVVHFAVVLLPLAAIALVVIVLFPRWRPTYGWVVVAGLAAGTGAAFVATQSGQELAQRVGTPERHAQLGDLTAIVAAGLLFAAIAWFFVARSRAAGTAGATPERGLGSGIQLAAAIAAIVLALGTVGLSVAAGHTGAQAVWDGTITTETPAPAPTSGPEATVFSLADVREHATPADCWSAIDGTVYDLTSWISQHPGGESAIEGLCGRDGTAAFRGQHGTADQPNDVLAGFAIGTVE